ncbi:single-stranded DNA-binding protein [Malacoplasma penetrans]|uniref:Single-stranded DNA-binding protein n=1 Tax=Malacoplasma penetrans (strain HF-2) TaxID=272633 RepID=SSB_MALP2|nr:single-stranded DNA-binding protein [Malacoplasma penetrans]Q8EWT6.1 RecName: Full=Single-stranded DNA-binding protein; Short=SSB [Malacoplasma penetrans HF-2]RXY97310.1 single-stranded DNA-binding protein [Malacoplasma penetrans]BAC43907.1 single-strand DNA binding protein [Malacoplasma penetrans HF-2]
MNKVFIVGRLAQDPQQFVTQNGITQSRISIASSDNWNKNETYFFPCVAWQSTANFINSYLHKGDLVAIDGKLIRRSYVSKEGKTVYVIEIVIESIKPLSSKNSNNAASSIDKNYNPTNTKNNNYSQQSNMSVSEAMDDFESNFAQKTSSTNITSKNEEKETFKDDPFALNDDEDPDQVVSLDWLDEFKE